MITTMAFSHQRTRRTGISLLKKKLTPKDTKKIHLVALSFVLFVPFVVLFPLSLPLFLLGSGQGEPFGRSALAQTPSRHHLDSARFDGPEACAKCHPRQYLEWRGSAHAYALVDPIFIACNRNAQLKTAGRIGSRCVGCHSPLGARTGELSPAFTNVTGLDRKLTAGVSCEICHRMEAPAQAAPIGNAGFGLNAKKIVYGRLYDPASSPAHESMTSEFIGESAFCGSCHDVLHEGETLEKAYAEWSSSTYATDKDQRCQDCHMLRYSGRAAVDGPFRETLRRHNFPAVSTPLVPFPNRGYQEEQVKAFLRTAARMSVLLPPRAEANASMPITVLVKNVGAGHNLPTGLSTFRQMWLEVTAKDGAGNILFRSGHLDANGDLIDRQSDLDTDGDPSLVNFSDRFVDAEKREVSFFFEASHIVENSLRPLEERGALYNVPVPGHVADQEIRLRVRLLFRSFPPYGLRFLKLDHLVDRMPIRVMDSFTARIPVVRNLPRPVEYAFPGSFATLQEAIDTLRDGDRILVAPGEYTLDQPLDFHGKAIEVKSRAGRDDTTLRLSGQAAASTTGSVVMFRSGEGRGARLEGFTLVGGRGTVARGVRQGGGIYIRQSSPTIVENRILECGAEGGIGGGIASDGGRPLISRNDIRSCWAERGGAIALRSTLDEEWVLERNLIEGNFARFGGGLYVERGASVRLERCLLAGNVAKESGGAVHASDNVRLTVNHSTIVYNETRGEGEERTGERSSGTLSSGTGHVPRVSNSILWGNTPAFGNAQYRYSILEVRPEAPQIAAATNLDTFPLFHDPGGSWEPATRSRRRPKRQRLPLPGRWQGGDYRLLPQSPAIDRGDPRSPVDPDDSRADIGAFFAEQPLRAFVRGDTDGDGTIAWRDLAALAGYLFGSAELPCKDAADVDDGGQVNTIDLLALAVYLFSGRLRPVAPFPDCGLDPTFGEGLSCETKGAECEPKK